MKSLYLIKGEVRLAHLRDEASAKLARDSLLQHIRREPDKMLRAGPISLWLRGGLDLDRVEELLEHLVLEGVLRPATKDELKQSGFKHGYFVTPAGLEILPPEDRSYGAL
jgi:hypothetical protein